ncbi:hypothetical protein PR048_006580 [Dryococelus australis]|uniref:Gustatory receptor n=1 Tax=Dryococelus australis TaxID=614101 RepID=A0ABQ9ICL4_9NEOP|nr:hypothetical protein PR048_006580 [Dryococelus australis]
MYPILNVQPAHEDHCRTTSQHATSQHQQGIQAARGSGEEATAEVDFTTCLEPIGTASRVLGLETLRAHRQVHNGINQMLGLKRSVKATVYTIVVVIVTTVLYLNDLYINVTYSKADLLYAISYTVPVTQVYIECLAGLIVLFNVMTAFVFAIFFIFLALVSLVSKSLIHEKLDNFSLSLITVIWSVIHISQTVVIICACSSTVRAARNIACIVQELLLKQGIDDEARVELKEFADQIDNTELEFTAAGFFILDLPLIPFMAGSIISYILVLLQLRPPEK